MKYLSINKSNDLVIANGDTPIIGDQEVLVDVKAIGVNRADILQRFGNYPPPKGESEILGLEMSGVIAKVGQHVEHWKVGQRVFGLVPGGAYAEQVKLLAAHLFALPPDWTFEQGASVAEVYLTAYQSLFTIARLSPGQSVMIHAGASGVGTAAIQLAKAIDCEVVVTVSSDSKAKSCLALGADYALNYNEVDFVKWVKENKPAGFDVIIDVVAAGYVNRNIQVSAMDGHIVILSILGGRYAEKVDVAKMLLKRVTITASTLRNRTNDYKTELVNALQRDFGFQDGQLKPVIDSVLPWEEATKAHQLLIDNCNVGKVILTIN